jgi:signal transduction histidine kinase
MRLFEDRANLGRIEPWLRAVGLATWAFVGFSRGSWTHPTWLLPWLVYGGALVAAALRSQLPDGVNLGLLLVQSAAALVLPSFGFAGFEGLLLSIVVAQVPTVLCFPASVVWAVGQIPFLLVVVFREKGLVEQMDILGAYSAFCAFALLVYWIHLQERRARTELARSHASLLTTRALLVESSLQAERLRISRELHDSLGHHLTALSVQLELATRLTEGAAAKPVELARAISKESLAEVRRVVDASRSSTGVDLVPALRALAAAIPAPVITIEAPDDLSALSGAASHAIFRSVQEAITNSVKHASARHVRVELSRDGSELEVLVHDDGVGARSVSPGNGLEGIRDRIALLGGRAIFEPRPGRGFAMRLRVPDGSMDRTEREFADRAGHRDPGSDR